ncbi:Calcineurin-like phosphoesterase superfamily domain protein [Enhygromyxa salina]|uniref:Calcineurin-like phosphoesterase superfamily domain protein n=1 Tax=Enhygromyxa salina TaxID=215803 RepID=A0A2S9XGJ6_9BACT|nr:metallophosphoesterase [Enhygromyxa salina]PRP91996.1 Calcineurin-like phosphoesterase superfamily domain protein [Enhygromyxa salina]
MRQLLLISDLHLGSHLKLRTRGEFVHLAARLDETLPQFLDHYARLGTWQLVINGDFIDFWNVEIGAHDQDPVELAVERLHAVLDAYPGVEDALISFLDAGNSIVFVAGNHDAEFLYPEVGRAFAERLEGALDGGEDPEQLQSKITATGITTLDEVGAGQVRFVPWFVREGGAWIEHGHLFDPACSTHAQLSPTRGGRLVQSVAEVATRRFTNRMPEIDYDAADRFTTLDYFRWAIARGWRFMVRVVFLYLRMVGGMLGLWVRSGRVDKAGRAAHEERLAKLAKNAGLQMSALTALENMAPPPSSASVGGVLSVTALDLALSAVTPALLVPLIFWASGWSLVFGIPLGLGLGCLAALQVKRRRSPRNVARDMLEVASSVGEVTGTRIVLMGHSHRGSVERRGQVIYGNSGSWLDGSHLVVRRDERGEQLTEVELRRWRNGGITILDSMRVLPS